MRRSSDGFGANAVAESFSGCMCGDSTVRAKHKGLWARFLLSRSRREQKEALSGVWFYESFMQVCGAPVTGDCW